jgi:hypothetical protein
VAFVHEQPVNAQLFKGNNVVLAGVVGEPFKPRFEILLGLFHLLDSEAFAAVAFQFCYPRRDFVNLFLN